MINNSNIFILKVRIRLDAFNFILIGVEGLTNSISWTETGYREMMSLRHLFGLMMFILSFNSSLNGWLIAMITITIHRYGALIWCIIARLRM